MKFVVVSVGKPKYSFWQAAAAHYLDALGPLAEIETVEIKDQESDPEKEGEAILTWLERRKLWPDGKNRLVLLDEKGKSLTSVDFAGLLGHWQDSAVQRVIFVVGGPFGWAPEMKKAANLLISLGAITLPHDLARVVLLEQIYRGMHILAGTKYHHA